LKTEIPIQELPLKGVGLLRAVMREISIDPEKQPQEYVLVLHARHIAKLAEEIVFLEAHNKKAAAPVIARAIYESLFKIGLALKNPELAAEKTLREMEWSMIQGEMRGAQEKDLKEIRKRPEYKMIGETVASLKERWKLSGTQISSDKKLSTFWCANEAGMIRFYHGQYALLSACAHGSGDTFIYHGVDITTGYVLPAVTSAMNEAITKIVRKYHKDLSEGLLIEVQSFEQMFKSYVKTGKFMEFLKNELTGNKSPKPTSPEKQFERN
jgi:hypothetical protein